MRHKMLFVIILKIISSHTVETGAQMVHKCHCLYSNAYTVGPSSYEASSVSLMLYEVSPF
jgi:hypothetical protein